MKKMNRKEFLKLSAMSVVSAGALAGCAGGSKKTIPIRPALAASPLPTVSGKEVAESARSVPVMAETDVLVVGGGPSGLSAALASAKEGVKTILLERFGFFGGVITQTSMGPITWYRYAKTIDAGGNIKLF